MTKAYDSCPSKLNDEMFPSHFEVQSEWQFFSYHLVVDWPLRNTVMFWVDGFALQHQSSDNTYFSLSILAG